MDVNRKRVTPERDFDEVYYRVCYADAVKGQPDLYRHYCEQGAKAGFNPNPFFSTLHYLEANPDISDYKRSPLEHFRRSTARIWLHISPLFDPAFYQEKNPDLRPGRALYVHYVTQGAREGRAPNALFDPVHYCAQLEPSSEGREDPLTHYLGTGWKDGLSPHPLFDPDHYQSQLAGNALLVPPLAHYLERGWRDGLSPHPLFDPEYYAKYLDAPLTQPALVDYLRRKHWDSTPHYLFSDTCYLAAVEHSALRNTADDYRTEAPLLHYVRVGARHGLSPHPLFDVGFYRHSLQRLLREQQDQTDPHGAPETDMLRHYCESGHAQGLCPTPLFDAEFYKSQCDEPIDEDPFRHYMVSGFPSVSPHPGIDLGWYARRKPEFLSFELPVALDILMTPQHQRISPHPAFDPQFYLDRNPDIRDSGTCPVLHFLEHGVREARQPNRLFTYPYAHRLADPQNANYANPVDAYFRAEGHKRRRVLFLGHDASRSGAPLVLLALIRHLSQISGIECLTILGRGGPLIDDFVDCSFTYVVESNDNEFLEWNRHSGAFLSEMSKIADNFDNNPPDLVVCNSLESRHLADFFASRGFGPLVNLVHEVADPYDNVQLSRLLAQAEASIFVSKYQLSRMQKKLAFEKEKASIVQFGALDASFGSGDREEARRALRLSLGIGAKALVVLGCGTMNFRKGIDLFADVASRVIKQLSNGPDIHFVWVGGGETHYDSAHYWANKAVKDAGCEARVHFLGGKAETEQYYLASDLFLMTSRADPFPCVIQEAMACGLPVISFEGKSGAAEAYGDSGISVAFDTNAMTETVVHLLTDDADREARSARALALQNAKPSLPEYAANVFSNMAHVAPEITAIVAQHSRMRTSRTASGPTVLLAIEDWDYSERNLFAQLAVKAMRAAGLDAKLLFVCGQRTFDRGGLAVNPPAVPFTFLYPKSGSLEHIREELLRVASQVNGPCGFVPYSRGLCYDLLYSLPPQMVALEILHGTSDEQLDRVFAFSHHLAAIICTSPVAAAMLETANGSLATKLLHIAPQLDARTMPEKSDRNPVGSLHIVSSLPSSVDAALECVALARLLRDQKIPARISVIADHVEVRAIRGIAADLLASGTLTVVGRPSEAERHAIMAQADVYLAAPRSSGDEVTLVEALAHGCVPILTQVLPGMITGLDDGRDAFVIEGINNRLVVDRLARLVEEKGLLNRMAWAARKRFDDQFAHFDRLSEKLGAAVAKAIAKPSLQTRRWQPEYSTV